jgi:hypothetical protein
MSSDKVKHRDKQRLPKSDYKPTYPLNRAEITPSGHEIHYDDTPGNRRIRTAHASGTYTEMGDDGRTTTVVVGNKHEYVKQGTTVSIDQNNDVKIGGHNTLKVDGGTHIEIKGQTNIVLGAGKHTITTPGDLKIGAKNIEVTAEQDFSVFAEKITLDAKQGGSGAVIIRGPEVYVYGYEGIVNQTDRSFTLRAEEGIIARAGWLIHLMSAKDIALSGGGSADKGMRIVGADHVVLSRRTWVGQPNINTRIGPTSPRCNFI